MRVLLTTPYDLAMPGGVNRHALGLLDALTRRGIEARLVGPSSAEPLASSEADPRMITLGRVRVKSMNGAQSRVTLDTQIGGAVKALLREFRPDVLHVEEPFLPLLNTFCLWHATSAVRVGTFHTYSETSRGYLWAWPYCQWVNRRLHARMAVSVPAREFAAQFHPTDYAIVPNAVKLPPIERRRLSRPLGNPIRLLFVGRSDEPRKGFGVLLAALRRLAAEMPGAFILEVAGPGSERWQQETTGLPVRFTGRLSDEQLTAAYVAADVCVLPSVGGERFGLVALEALAHGVPVVASRIRGYAEWLEGTETGRLVRPHDEADLAAALRDIAANPAQHALWTQRAPEVAARYEWDIVAARVVEIYTKTLARHRPLR